MRRSWQKDLDWAEAERQSAHAGWEAGKDHDQLMEGFLKVEPLTEEALQQIEQARSGIHMLVRYIEEIRWNKEPSSDLRTIGAAIYGDLGILEEKVK